MSQVPFPSPGPDGDEPLAGAGARDGAETGALPSGGAAESGGAEPAGTPADSTTDDCAAPAGTPAVGPACDDLAAAGGPPAAAVGADGDDDDDDDFDADADLARFLADVDAGLIAVPPEVPESLAGMPAGPAVWFTLGEAADVDPAELAVMAGPAGLGGQVFASERAADAMRPGPLLSILAEQAGEDPAVLSDDELMGLVSAARRLQARAEWLELAGIAEFTRRRQAQHDAAVARHAKPGRRDGEFADAELGFELVVSAQAAGDRMDMAASLATRLPCTFAGMAAGMIDGERARTIWYYTRFLSDEHAALADAILAEAAPGLRPDQLTGKACRLEFKLDPAAVKKRREHARRQGRRVETRREASGNLAFGARELSIEEALAAKAANDADVAALRAAGMPGTLRELRVLAFLDRQAGRNPMDRLTTPADNATGDASNPASPGPDPAGAGPRDHDRRDPGGEPGYPDWDDDEGGEDDDEDGGSGHDGGPRGGQVSAPLPALINLIIVKRSSYAW